jgi:hypothetical protein
MVPQEGLTPEQKREYDRLRLSVEVEGRGIGSYGGGSISYASWRRWQAYEGFTPILEEDFFAKAGYESEAQKAMKRRKTGNVLFLGGTGTVVLGLSMMSFAGDDAAVSNIGALISLIGLVPMYMSLDYKLKNWAPYSTVEGIANTYNRQLLERIRRPPR